MEVLIKKAAIPFLRMSCPERPLGLLNTKRSIHVLSMSLARVSKFPVVCLTSDRLEV